MNIDYDDLSEDARQKIVEDVKEELQPSTDRRTVIQGSSLIGAGILSFVLGQQTDGAQAAPNSDGSIGAGDIDLSSYTLEENESGNFVVKDGQSDVLTLTDTAVLNALGQWGSSSNRDDWYADYVDANVVNADEVVIGGRLYDLDGTIDVSTVSSTTYSMSTNADEVIVLPARNTAGFDQVQVNGDTGSNYEVVDNSDTTSTASQWGIPFLPAESERLHLLADRSAGINMRCPLADAVTGATIAGSNANVSPPINQFTLINAGGSGSLKARVYRRDMSI